MVTKTGKSLFYVTGVTVGLALTVLFIMGAKDEKLSMEPKSVAEAPNKLSDTAERSDVTDLPSITLDDVFDGKFSYSSFSPNWVSSTEYIYRDSEGIKKHSESDESDQIIVSNAFYASTGALNYYMSSDLNYMLVRTSYHKQWRHSFNASYTAYKVDNEQVMLGPTGEDIQHQQWSPTGHSFLWVTNNDIYYQKDIENPDTMKRLTSSGNKNTIYNGVADWVYEEEMLFTKDTIYWSHDSKYIGYLVTDDTGVQQIEFSMYDDGQYPRTVNVAYPKAGTKNPVVKLYIYDTDSEITYSSEAPDELKDEDHLFSRLYWFPDSTSYLVFWLNRISSRSVVQKCNFPSDGSTQMTCTSIEAGSEENDSGWIGDEGGIPFQPMMLADPASTKYFSVFTAGDYWQAAMVDYGTEERTFLTTGTQVVTSLVGYDETNDYLYFMSAYPLPRNRQLMRVKTSEALSAPKAPEEWECLTCDLDQTRCGWVSASFGPEMKYLVISCSGPDVPMTYLIEMNTDGTWMEPVVKEDNADLVQLKTTVKWPEKNYGSFTSENGDEILYQWHRPADFDESKSYPVLIEVYGGPGYQKVQDRYTTSWAPIHMVSTYDMIVVSLDGRGSAFRGNQVMHAVYGKLGQFEKIDTTEVARHFAGMDFVDQTRMAVWGWSYGGYTTSFTISLGSGMFKCGFAVAPLASRYYYDTIHTERFMKTPEMNPDGYEKCSILNSDLTNFGKAWYSIIHGTADDNVHFQNAALITKALIDNNVDFDDFFYADEAHSVNTGANANKHIYKLLTSKTRQCFGLYPSTYKKNPLKAKRNAKVLFKAAEKKSLRHSSDGLNQRF